MRALLILILMYGVIANDHVHYPTTHPGVCNILAFVSDHVDEVIHVAHDEFDAVATDKNSAKPKALAKEMEKMKSQVQDIMEMAQCLASDFEKPENDNKPLALSSKSQNEENENDSQKVQASSKDVPHSLESSNSSSLKVQEITKNPIQQNSQQLLQHVAEIHDSRHIRDVAHIIGNFPNPIVPNENKLNQVKIDAENPQVVLQSNAPVENIYRNVRDVAHILESIPAVAVLVDGKSNQETKAAEVAQVGSQINAPLEENIFRNIRDVVHAIKNKQQISDNHQHDSAQQNDKKVDNLLKEHVALKQRKRRDVSHLLLTHSTSSFPLENEVKQELNLDNLKVDYSQTADILPEETQLGSKVYAEQLFPPTIGEHVDFHGRRIDRSVVEEEIKIPNIEEEQHLTLDKKTKRFARDITHVLLQPSQETAEILAQNSQDDKQHVSIDENVATLLKQNSQADKQQVAIEENVATLLKQNSQEDKQQVVIEENVATSLNQNSQDDKQQVAIEENIGTLLNQNSQKDKQQVAIEENVATLLKPTILPRLNKRNVEIGRNVHAFRAQEQKSKKNKRSPDEHEDSFNPISVAKQNGKSKSLVENKYIQIIKPRIRRAVKNLIQESKEVLTQGEVSEKSSQHVAYDNVSNKRIVRSTESLSDVSLITSTHNPSDLQEDLREVIKPTVKVQHRPLPVTQFARRNVFKKNVSRD